MKRTSLVLISILLVATLLLSACAKTEKGTIVVVTDATFPPFESTDDSGNLVGLDIDLMNKIAEETGLTIEWKNIPFDSVIAGVTECQYPVAIAGIYIRDDRKENMLFTDPYMTAGVIIAVNKETTDINSIDDLKGKIVAAQLGTSGETKAQEIENVTYKPYDTYDLAFLDLANGQVDAVIADNPVAENYVKANPDKLKLVGDVFDAEPYGIAFCKTETALRDQVNDALKKLMDSGYVAELINKYMK